MDRYDNITYGTGTATITINQDAIVVDHTLGQIETLAVVNEYRSEQNEKDIDSMRAQIAELKAELAALHAEVDARKTAALKDDLLDFLDT